MRKTKTYLIEHHKHLLHHASFFGILRFFHQMSKNTLGDGSPVFVQRNQAHGTKEETHLGKRSSRTIFFTRFRGFPHDDLEIASDGLTSPQKTQLPTRPLFVFRPSWTPNSWDGKFLTRS